MEHSHGRAWYEENLRRLRTVHHSRCLFNRHPSILPGLRFEFDDAGALRGEFICEGCQQGYDEMAHGGVLAAIVDASMAQCLMGHGIVGYTADLSVKYRKPVMIHTMTTFETSITAVNYGLLYQMKCTMAQDHGCVVEATGRFFKMK